ncbi:MAG: WD40 repeat domain-containing protein [bacterium]
MKKNMRLFLYLFFALFFMQQKTHASFFNPSPYTLDYGTTASTARWNANGTYLAVGGTNFPTDLTIYGFDGTYVTPKATESFGNGAFAVDWSPNGQYLAIGGDYSTNALIIYKWDGVDTTLSTSKYHGSYVTAVAWNPAGNALAVGGNWNNNNLALYNWDGYNTLSLTTSKYYGTQVNGLAWNPAGTKLAVAGQNRYCGLSLYDWNGSTLTLTTSKYHGISANALAWTSTGTYLAVGGNYNTNNVIIYTLSGPSSLTLTTSISFGTNANTLSWSYDDRYLTVGGDNSSADLTTYEWNGSTLTPIPNSQASYGNGVYGASWSPYSDYLAVAGNNSSNDFTLYTSNGYLNGTKNNVTLSNHYLFTDGGYANGLVNFTNGCTVLPGKKLKLALLTPFSGGLDLRDTATLQLEDDLYLDADVTLTTGGYIYGQGHAIYLENDLTIPDNTIMHISNDTIIDGNGHKLNLGHESQLFIDWGVTLTLRNMTFKNTVNNQDTPPVRLNGKTSKLALDNIHLELSSDFSFTYGQLFIHNDVLVTGTSKFNYLSSHQSYIDTCSTLYFDLGTTFSFAPYLSTNKDLIYMKDASATLYLNGTTLAITHTGLRLTRGRLLIDNTVTFTSQYYEGSHKQAPSNGLIFGNAIFSDSIYDLDVHLLGGANIGQYTLVKVDEI